MAAANGVPQAPAHPERVCWGCDRYCPANAMRCGNGSDRTPHPAELFGDDWHEWEPPVEGGASVAGTRDAEDPSRDAPDPGGSGQA